MPDPKTTPEPWWAGLDLPALKGAHEQTIKKRDALRRQMLSVGNEAFLIKLEIVKRERWPRHDRRHQDDR